ncbi:MAG: RNA polymerase sigma factor for flagellar operon FliA [Planctomycetota bacterium]|jgi:RNA polymerase sigma factor for flagellar operon FliA
MTNAGKERDAEGQGIDDLSVGTAGEFDRDALILDHLGLLHHIVGRMAFDVAGVVDRDDLEGWGMIGLIAAADAWDASRGLKFSTYAYPKIRGAILDELRHMDFLPRGRREKVRALDLVVRRLEQEQGVTPSPEEIAEAMGIELEEVGEIMQSARVANAVSLEGGPSRDLGALLRDPTCEDPVDSAAYGEMKTLLIKAIANLPEQEQAVITLYYAEELLLKEIGKIMGVTESRVSQIHSSALYRLNRELKGEPKEA